jgi:hypothetical protein
LAQNRNAHGIAELLTLVGAVRRLAFDRNLPRSEGNAHRAEGLAAVA